MLSAKSLLNHPPREFNSNLSEFKTFDSASFRFGISKQNWNSINIYEDPNNMWDTWKNRFLQCVDKHTPLRKKRVRAHISPRITHQLKKRMHDRCNMLRSNNANDWLKFWKCRIAVNNEIKQAKEKYYRNAPMTMKVTHIRLGG